MILYSTFHDSFFRAVDYYAAIDGRLATRFIDVVERAKRDIARFPGVGRTHKTYRALPLKDFPYSICYCETAQRGIVCLVLYHHKQSEPLVFRS